MCRDIGTGIGIKYSCIRIVIKFILNIVTYIQHCAPLIVSYIAVRQSRNYARKRLDNVSFVLNMKSFVSLPNEAVFI